MANKTLVYIWTFSGKKRWLLLQTLIISLFLALNLHGQQPQLPPGATMPGMQQPAPSDSPPVKYKGGIAIGEGSFEPGSTINIIAQANPGYEFDHWQGKGMADSNSPETSVTMDTHRKIKPVFKRVWNVIGIAEPAEAGTVNGSGLYPLGDQVMLDVQPNEGYTFKGWIGDQVNDVTDLHVTIDVTGNHDLIAVFESDNEQNQDQQKQQDQQEKQDQEQKQQDQQEKEEQKEGDRKQENSAPAPEPQPLDPGQMTREEARQLLESLKNEEKKLPLILLEENQKKQRDREIKDW